MTYLDSIFGSEMEPSLLLCCFYLSLMFCLSELTLRFVLGLMRCLRFQKSNKRLFDANRDQIGTIIWKVVSIETFSLKRDHSTSSDFYKQI